MKQTNKLGTALQQLQALGPALLQPMERPEDESEMILLARRLLRVRDRDGRERALEANRAQREFERARKQKNIVLKARQMGMTTWISARFFLKTITQPGTLTVQVAHTQEAAESIFRIVQRFWACLPEEYRTGPLKRSRANVRQMIFAGLDSEFRVVSAADENAGRGLTIQNLHCSEVSRWKGNAYETLAGLRAAMAPDGELVIESTPNGAAGCFYDEWIQATESGLAKHFFPWWLEEAYVASPVINFTDEELELKERHGLTPEQIGYRRMLQSSFRRLRVQEFAEDPERCFRASGNCCFEIEAIERRLLEVHAPDERLMGDALRRWLYPVPMKQYLLAVDPAGGGSEGDPSAIEIIDLSTGIQCAELRERIRPLELAKAAVELAREYNDAMIVVERNNHGINLCTLLERVEGYTNLYTAPDGLVGFLTTASSKPRIISLLGSLILESPEIFKSKWLLQECRSFVTHANGSTGAIAGAHDDCVMAMAIAQDIRLQQLQHPGRS